MRSQIELLRREKSLSHTWIVTTMSLHTMSVIFIDWRKGPGLEAQQANDRNCQNDSVCQQTACTSLCNSRMITSSFACRKPAVVSAELDQLQIARVRARPLQKLHLNGHSASCEVSSHVGRLH
jgi:hypothetical protein